MNKNNLLLVIYLSVGILSCTSESESNESEDNNSDVTTTEETDTTSDEIVAEDTLSNKDDFDMAETDPADFPSYDEEQIAKILRPGTFHEEEVWEGVEDENWFGLYKNGNEYSIRSVEMETSRVHDDIIDPDGVDTGWEVSVDDQDNCLLLVAGTDAISEGPVRTAKIGKDEFFPEEEKTFKMGNKTYTIKGTGLTIKSEGLETSFVKNYKLTLSSNINGKEVEQMLVAKPGFDEEMIDIIWAGDMDGDGALDLLLNTSRHYNSTVMSLYLSSKASNGKIVKYVGSHWSSGC